MVYYLHDDKKGSIRKGVILIMTETIKEILMRRDSMTSEEANSLIIEARYDLNDRLEKGEYPEDICEEWFGLEPDYIMDLIE